jgi:peptide/nickel transport system ATP-binding protein
MEKTLEVSNLKVQFNLDEGTVKAVDGMDFSIYSGKCLGIVGESGCGKSVTAQSIMQIVPTPPGKIVDGKIIYQYKDGNTIDIASLKPSSKKMRSIRGKEISMVFQEPMNSLSPVHSIGDQIGEVVQLHQKVDKREGKKRAVAILKRVRIPRPEVVVDEYPHQLSGGMRQRVMIALALSCEPSLLIADEPTTALDVTVQAQILELINDLQNDFGMSLMLITHDLGVIAQNADHVAVVYLGKIVEYGSVMEVFNNPLHPYTRALFASIPSLEGTERLHPITGSVPDPYAVIRGCPFRERCSEQVEMCSLDDVPNLVDYEGTHKVRCFLYDDGRGNRGERDE